LRVREYCLFDPYKEYLDPPEQLFRLVKRKYQRTLPRHGRLQSAVLGLYLERDGKFLRLYNPATKLWLPTPEEIMEQRDQLIQRLTSTEVEVKRLRRELERLKRGNHKKP
jgi:transposase